MPMASHEPRQQRARVTRRRLLDAAVDELLDHGYARLTTQEVATRAGVSRGAQQNHFPRKSELVGAAVRHLAARQLDELRGGLQGVPQGRQRVAAGLDVVYEQYGGRLFAAVIELSLAARGDAELRAVVNEEERAISRTVHDSATEIFGPGFPQTPEIGARWAMALSTVRGLALLKLLGHSSTTVDRQWQPTRRQLLELFDAALT